MPGKPQKLGGVQEGRLMVSGKGGGPNPAQRFTLSRRPEAEHIKLNSVFDTQFVLVQNCGFLF